MLPRARSRSVSSTARAISEAALNSPNIVLGTITLGGGEFEFIQTVKDREDIELIVVTHENRDDLPELLLKKIASLSER